MSDAQVRRARGAVKTAPANGIAGVIEPAKSVAPRLLLKIATRELVVFFDEDPLKYANPLIEETPETGQDFNGRSAHPPVFNEYRAI